MAVLICDVGPRDGLQNEDRVLDPSVRETLCDRLAAAGLKRIEAASFVNPKLVPQMAGAEDVMAALNRRPGVAYAGLVLNEKGYERALAARVDEVHYAFAATDEFGRRNQNADSEQGLHTALALVARARADKVPITVTISVAFGCPFEGPVPAKRVLGIVERLMAAPADEIEYVAWVLPGLGPCLHSAAQVPNTPKSFMATWADCAFASTGKNSNIAQKNAFCIGYLH